MSIQLILSAMGDFSELEVQQAIQEARNEKISEMVDENEVRTKEAYKESVGAMRASYQMMTGFAQIMGGSMGSIFSALYGVGYATINMMTAIAEAQFFIPGMQLQSIMMIMTLMSAFASLGAIVSGQTDLSQRIGGLTSALTGFGGMIDSFSM